MTIPTFATQISKLIKAIKADITALYASGALKAVDANVVHKAGAETITGVKTINLNAAAPPAVMPGTALQTVGADGVQCRTLADAFGINATLTHRRANGTAAAPSAVLSGNVIGAFNSAGYGATAYSTGRSQLLHVAAENWTDTEQGAYIGLHTTKIGTTTIREVARVLDAGDFALTLLGAGFQVKEGSNAKQGTAMLVAGSSVVANTSVTANSHIFINRSAADGALGHLSYTKSAGVGFTVTSTSATEASSFDYEIFEPA